MIKGIPFPPGFTKDRVLPPVLLRDAIPEEAELVPVKLPKRIGVLLGDLQEVNVPALKFLILQLNSVQRSFEFELLKCKRNDEFVAKLSGSAPIDKETVRREVPEFLRTLRLYLEGLITTMSLREPPPDYFVLVTLARFVDEFYTMRQKNLSILALGNWKRIMAPPSILEFIITLLLREAVASISRSLRGSIHLGTKGCLFDFTFHLEDARFKVLQSFICTHCRKALETDGYPGLADQLTLVLTKGWLGESSDPSSPAGIVSNLGFDLFLTKGLKPTAWEGFLSAIQQEGIKELLKLIGGVILAGLLLWLGLKNQ